MGILPILQQGREVPMCLPNRELPDFYMADYSIMGLLVTRLNKTHQVLEDQNFEVYKKSDHLEVSVASAVQISEIADLLSQNGIDYGMADIVDQVYQG